MKIIKYGDPEEVRNALWSGVGGDTGWDIGANIGQSVRDMAPVFDEVHSFEPAQECQAALTAQANAYDNVEVWMIAISDNNGTVELVDIPDKIDSGQLVSFEAAGMEYDPYQDGHKRDW